MDDLIIRVPRVLEKLLLRQGEAFVSAVLANNLTSLGVNVLTDIVVSDISSQPPNSKIIQHYTKVLSSVVQALLAQPEPSTHIYLRRLANSYTLLSFLNEVPDVQSATRKLFTHGTIWLDTTVLLPLIAEQLEEDNDDSRLTKIVIACRNAGVDLRVTSGVLQEINAHMNNAITCSQYAAGAWRGRIPYLYYQFIHAGRSASEFRHWVSIFRGDERPEDDLAQFLNEVFGIKRRELSEEMLWVPEKIRFAVDRLWTTAHEKRRQKSQMMDDATTRILIHHDIEMYLGVIALRQKEDVSELGYRHWLLTLDHNAWSIRDRLREEFPTETPMSPLLSLSYLVSTMTFGPVRGKVGKNAELALPLILDVEMSESMPHDIVGVADTVRKENAELPEFVIRRKVRDAIDRARRGRGRLGYSSIFDVDEDEQWKQFGDDNQLGE